MVGRIVLQLCFICSEARKLKAGDVISKLSRFTKLSHQLGTSTPKPALFIMEYFHVGYSKLPDSIILSPLDLDCDLSMVNTSDPTDKKTTSRSENTQQISTESDAECNNKNRLCSVYGISMISCICKTNPVGSLDLDTIREDCYFADKKVEDMTNSQKRCMIYWWYATNKHRMRLPNCLVKAVRDEYPEDDGVYEGFSFGD